MPTVQDWFKAAENGDSQFIRANCAVFRTATTTDGMTALMISACCGHIIVVQELCAHEQGCTTGSGKAAIHFGLDSDNWDIVSLMLPYEASIRNTAGDTLLHWAVRVRAKSCIPKLLVQFGPLTNTDGLTAAQLAQNLGYADLLPLLGTTVPALMTAAPFPAVPAAPAAPGLQKFAPPNLQTIPQPPIQPVAPASIAAAPIPAPVFSVSSSSFLSGPTTTSQASHVSLCDNCTKLSQQNSELSAELNRIKEQNASLLSQYQTAMEAVTSTQSANSSFLTQITESQSTIARLEAELEKQKALVRNSSNESTALMLQVSTSSTHVSSLQSELHLKDEEIKMLKTKVAELEENTTEIIRMTETAINARATVVANQLASQQEERAFLQGRVSRLETENVELVAKLAASQSAVDSLVQSQTAAQEQNTNLLKTITDLNTRMAQFSSDNANSSKRIAELEEQMGSKNTEILELKKQLTMVQSGIIDSVEDYPQPSGTAGSMRVSTHDNIEKMHLSGYHGSPGTQRCDALGPAPSITRPGNITDGIKLNTSQLLSSTNMSTAPSQAGPTMVAVDASVPGGLPGNLREDAQAVVTDNTLTKSTAFRDKDGNTALILAAAIGDISTVISLVPYQEKVTNTMGETALMKAAENGHLEVVCALLDKQVGKATYSGKTALMSAALNGHIDVCRLLIPHEAGMSRKDGWTALMSAARNNHLEIVRLLIDHEARRQTKDGTTALIKAIEHGNLDAVKILAPIEMDLTLKGGATALMKCKRTTYPEIYDYLRSLQD
ncbi:Protein 21.1 [Giardia lamblia P15]|uniref:Protein 21.1 n=1 Tax=Giardia intestinalis (strain P15) TaxID=658858 RepID=E1F3J6_GIAIA|nr:Protein 21.1 [Giardia lamblia P15]